MFKHWLRSRLGITDLSVDIDRVNNNLLDFREHLQDEMLEPLNTLASVLLTEDSDHRRVFSEKIGKRALNKMAAEHAARMHTEGKL